MSESVASIPVSDIQDQHPAPAGQEGAEGVAAYSAPIPTFRRGAGDDD